MSHQTVYLETLGCQMNVLDSELVLGQLRACGYTPTGDMHEADLVLVNTCSVRAHAEDKALSRLGALKRSSCRKPGRSGKGSWPCQETAINPRWSNTCARRILACTALSERWRASTFSGWEVRCLVQD